jgi:DNA (cytosine-5)-methyltransferase 1
MKHGSLFSGIGGFDLAAEWMGWENIFHCEWNPFGQKVLKHYWPKAISYHDITKTDFTIHRGNIDILTGGFPCQPYSMAGKRLGKDDERHLWPEMLRAIREIQPRWVVGENVFGLVNWSGGLVFHEVQTDLEAQGYEVFPYVLPAASVNAPHRRDRVWFVAYATGNGYDAEPASANNTIGQNNKQSRTQRKRTIEGLSNERTTPHTNSNGFNQCDCGDEIKSSEGRINALSDINESIINGLNTNTNGIRLRGESNGIGKSRFTNEAGEIGNWQNFPTQSPVCSRNDGLPTELDGITFSKWRNESIKAAGNAIVPQVVYQIFKAIEEYDQL